MCTEHGAAFVPNQCEVCNNYLNYTSEDKIKADLDNIMDNEVSEAATRMTPELKKTNCDTINDLNDFSFSARPTTPRPDPNQASGSTLGSIPMQANFGIALVSSEVLLNITKLADAIKKEANNVNYTHSCQIPTEHMFW